MLALALLALVVVVALAATAVGAALAARQRIVSAADAGALAAADTAIGLHPGVPCEVAGRVVEAHDAALLECRLDGLVATVTVGTRIAGVDVSVRARAGPPR